MTAPAVITVEESGVTTVVTVPLPPPAAVDITTSPDPIIVDVGSIPVGPPGTTVIAVPYNQWPPVDPQPDTLYLRLAP